MKAFVEAIEANERDEDDGDDDDDRQDQDDVLVTSVFGIHVIREGG